MEAELLVLVAFMAVASILSALAAVLTFAILGVAHHWGGTGVIEKEQSPTGKGSCPCPSCSAVTLHDGEAWE